MTQPIDPALYVRMEKVVRALSEDYARSSQQERLWPELRAIVAELPAPTDPDLLLAREVVATQPLAIDGESYLSGCYDNNLSVQSALAAIKRIRQQDGEAG